MMISPEILEKKEELITLRRDFHMHPELGFQEVRTSGIVVDYLKRLGLEPKVMAKTGVVATLYGNQKTDQTILLRADMDALMIQEENNIPYKSQNPGIMHACGHDAHTAILLVVAKILCENKDQLKGNIKFVFQPNEEVAGAGKMVEEGVLLDPPNTRSSVAPVDALKNRCTWGKIWSHYAEMYNFKIILTGVDGHSSAPDQCIDPIICAANIIQSLQSIQTREINSLKPTNIMFGRISAEPPATSFPKPWSWKVPSDTCTTGERAPLSVPRNASGGW